MLTSPRRPWSLRARGVECCWSCLWVSVLMLSTLIFMVEEYRIELLDILLRVLDHHKART
jgi:hypothetical protein